MSPLRLVEVAITSDLIVPATVGSDRSCATARDTYWVERGRGGGPHCIVRRRRRHVSDVTPPGSSAHARATSTAGATSPSATARSTSELRRPAVYRQTTESRAASLKRPRQVPIQRPVVDATRAASTPYAKNTRRRGAGRQHPRRPARGAGERGRRALVASGNEFYSTPRLSPEDAPRVAHLDHRTCPGTGASCGSGSGERTARRRPAPRAGGRRSPSSSPSVAAGARSTSSPIGTNWWNIYRRTRTIGEAVHEAEAEFGPAVALRHVHLRFAPTDLMSAPTRGGRVECGDARHEPQDPGERRAALHGHYYAAPPPGARLPRRLATAARPSSNSRPGDATDGPCPPPSEVVIDPHTSRRRAPVEVRARAGAPRTPSIPPRNRDLRRRRGRAPPLSSGVTAARPPP